MNFKKWDKIIEETRGEFIELEIYYTLKLNIPIDNMNKDSEGIQKQLTKLIDIIKDAYLHDETRLSLSFICDVACEYKNEILNNEDFTKWDLLEKCGKEI